MGGAWRGGTRRQSPNSDEREEGLNELGEAPPPYKPRDSVNGAPEAGSQARNDSSGLSIPLRALARDGRSVMKPPDYNSHVRPLPPTPVESSRSIEEQTLRPSTAIAVGGSTIQVPSIDSVSRRSLDGEGSSQRSMISRHGYAGAIKDDEETRGSLPVSR